MKKNIFILIFLLSMSFIPAGYGQDTLKATYGKFLTELNVNLFQGQLSLNNALNQVKFRYMYSGSYALRVGISVESHKAVYNYDNVYGTQPTKDDETGTTSMIGINIGIEKHFIGTKRLSPYIGAEITLGYKWSKYVIDGEPDITSTTTTTGAWPQYQILQSTNGYYYTINSYAERGFISYGVNIVTGFDFYMAKHLFIGYELQFGFINKNYSDVSVTSTGNTGNNPSPSPTNSARDFSFGPNIINGIRIGYVF